MISSSIQNYLHDLIGDRELKIYSVGGGCINETFRIAGNGKNFFLKINSAFQFPALFEKEKRGLEFLKKQNVIAMPQVVGCKIIGEKQILLLEWIGTGLQTNHLWKKFGEQLALLHSITQTDGNDQALFGFEEDNYIGSLIQSNTPLPNWIDFFVEYRLKPQIEMAHEKKLLEPNHLLSFETFFKKLPEIFEEEKPALLHGDLWNGNFMCSEKSWPVLIDPAIYFGHRSMDIGMTTLFGGFDKQFYEAYNYYFPFPENYTEQWQVCNLYPLLVHVNLFGSSYLRQIEEILKTFR